MSEAAYDIKWADLAFGSKKSINDLKATFVSAPRQLSDRRFMQLVKTYLKTGHIVLGIADEPYIDGFDGQIQFQTLIQSDVQTIIDTVNTQSPHKIYTLHYKQREARYIFEKLKFNKVILVNGSWLHAFHTRSEYYTLVSRGIDYELVSPFVDEEEARTFEKTHPTTLERPVSSLSPEQMLQLAADAAKQSYDYMFQTGAALGVQKGNHYEPILTSFNRVVPYQTYAMHHGASRETHFSPPNDLNHYDTVHAEVELLIAAQKQGTSLLGTTIFINLLPCPSCSRMLADTDIAEVVYQIDHSDGYAIKMLEAAGKTVSRLV